MAGNKGNAKTKNKDGKGKGVSQAAEDTEDVIDFAVLRKPVPTSITGFAQARKIFDLATEELKDLLTNECDLLYECKVCRNIFRSLANFISHKRVYCKEKFNSSTHGHFISNASVANELQQIKRMEAEYQEFLKSSSKSTAVVNNNTEENDEQIPLSKDLTAVYENIIKSRGIENKGDPSLLLKKIPSSSIAVFQTVSFEDKKADNMRTEVQELEQILSRNQATLQTDGQFTIEPSKDEKVLETVIQISDDDDDADILKCKICDLQFSTQKTLKFHMKYKHVESRLVYPCPDCLEIFSTSWSVYRHLFKVHRKTAAQVRRLRESIQSKAFRMNNPPASYERRRNTRVLQPPAQPLTEQEKRDQENQAWMDNMESLGSVPRCGGCGRTFERRAALAAHAATCQPRARALAAPAAARPAPTQPRPDAKKIEIQIRKDYHKGPTGLTILKPPEMEGKPHNQETPPQAQSTQPENNTEKEAEKPDDDENDDDEAPMDLDDDDTSNDSPEKPDIRPEDDIQPVIRLPYALQAEKSNLAAFKQRIAYESNFTKLLCKRCDVKLETVIQLYDHMAQHVNWVRFACKLCNFKHYKFEKLPEHVKTVHKLKGDSDFYYSTVKAIDGKEAMMLSACLIETDNKEESNDVTETSVESKRPESRPHSRRCSSDSSRLSDDSSSSSNVVSRKRRVSHSQSVAKKKKESNNDGEDQTDDISSNDKLLKVIKSSPITNLKAFEENSSDIDDIEEKISKRHSIDVPRSSVHSRRPVRKRTKVKNADFEYDLSNLLKMEAQGYKETTVPTKVTQPTPAISGKVTPTNTPKPSQPKKKSLTETMNTPELNNKECFGALATLSKKSVGNATAHLRTSKTAVFTSDPRPNMFARPMLPRIISKGDKSSQKNLVEDRKDNPTANKIKVAVMPPFKDIDINGLGNTVNSEKEALLPRENFKIMLKKVYHNQTEHDPKVPSIPSDESEKTKTSTPSESTETKVPEQNDPNESKMETVDTSLGINAVVPVKFKRESLELMKNPLINKNIADLSKAGMKTKILVIKPVNRKGDNMVRSLKNPLKFQTIKLKDPSKWSSEDKPSDQVRVVKVPKVPRRNSTASSNLEANASKSSDLEKNELIDVEKVSMPIEKQVNNKVETDVSEKNEAVETVIAEKDIVESTGTHTESVDTKLVDVPPT